MNSVMSDDLSSGKEGNNKALFSTEELSGSTEDFLLEKVVAARQALEADLAFLFVYDQPRSELNAYLSLDHKNEPRWQRIKWKTDAEICGFFVDRSPGWEQRVHNLLIPMLNKGTYNSSLLRFLTLTTAGRYGILGVASSKAGFFRRGDINVLDLVAENIFLYLENGKLESNSRWLVKAIDANIRFSKYLTSQPNNLEVVLKQVFEELNTILDAESCGVLFYDPERKELILQKPSFGLNDDKFQSYTLSTEDARRHQQEDDGIGVAVRVFLTGEPYICHTAEEDQITNKRIARIYGARSSLSVPLVVENQRIGVLHVINKKKGNFSVDDARLLELMAGQLAIVIENARLLKQMEQKNDILRHSMEIHSRLTRMVLRERDMEEIIQRLARLIGRDVIVQDKFFKILGTSLKEEERNLAQLEKAMGGALWQHAGFGQLFKQLTASRQAVNLPASPAHGLKQARLIAPITLSNNVLGYVSILEDGQRKLGELDYLAIEHAVTVFTLKMMQEKIAYDVAERIKGDFLNDLLSGNYQSDEEMLRRASYLGYDFSRPHQVIYVEYCRQEGGPENEGENKKFALPVEQNVFELVNNCLKNTLPGSLVVSQKNDSIVIVAPYQQQKPLPKPEAVAFLLRDTIKETVPGLNVLIGIGRVCNSVLDINSSYQEAYRAIAIVRKLKKEDEVVRYDSLGVYKLLFAVKDEATLQEFAHQLLKPILQYDREKNDILLQTLRNYLQCNCNNQKTADSLFIHLNTLKYRLQKIQDICGIDLNDPEERLNLQLALKMLEIKNI